MQFYALLFPWTLIVGTLAFYNWILAYTWNYALKDVSEDRI